MEFDHTDDPASRLEPLPATGAERAVRSCSHPFSAFLSPTRAVNGWVWGIGPIVQVPTITSKTLGSNVWGAGPAFVVVRTAHPWVYGTLINNAFSFGGTSGPHGTRYSVTTINPSAA